MLEIQFRANEMTVEEYVLAQQIESTGNLALVVQYLQLRAVTELELTALYLLPVSRLHQLYRAATALAMKPTAEAITALREADDALANGRCPRCTSNHPDESCNYRRKVLAPHAPCEHGFGACPTCDPCSCACVCDPLLAEFVSDSLN